MRPGYLRIYSSKKRRPGNIGDTEDNIPVVWEEVETGYIPDYLKYTPEFPFIRYPSRKMPRLRDPMTFNILSI